MWFMFSSRRFWGGIAGPCRSGEPCRTRDCKWGLVRVKVRLGSPDLRKAPRFTADDPFSGGDKWSPMSLRIFHGTALPGGVFVPKTAVGHRAEARCHDKFSSLMRTLHEATARYRAKPFRAVAFPV